MATVELSPTGPHNARPGAPFRPARRSPARRILGAPGLLGASLLVVLVYAVFAHGSTAAPAEPRLEVAVALVAVVSATALLWTGSLRLRLPPAAVAAVVLFAGFAGFTGVSLVWSVAPDLTWVEFNRTVVYVVVLLLAGAFGSSAPSAVERTVQGLLALVGLVVLYALLQKVLPGVHLGGVIDLNQTAILARLQEPIGYWNALALLLAMGAPLALALALRRDGPRRSRVVALIVLELTIVAGAFTFSRGGIVAFAVALVAYVALCGNSLRALMWAACALVAALPVVVIGLISHALSGDGVLLGRRETAGLLLALLLAGSATLLTLGAGRLHELERTVVLGERHRRRIGNALGGACAAVIVLGLLAVTASHRGLTGTVSHVWDSFTSTKAVSVSSPSRLLTDASGNRWTWWKEALGAFSARPLAGWGAGSFPTVHLLFRQNTLNVQHAHSALFEWLAEDGILGTLVILAAWGLILRAAFRTVRSRLGTDRLLAAALLAAGLAYSLHALIDWDWDIPGVTLPVLVMLGVLIGAPGSGSPAPLASRSRAATPTTPAASPSARLGAVGVLAVGLCAYAVSAALPSLAAGRAAAAEVAAAGSSPGSLRAAAADASLATRLDPLSDAGPLAAADIAIHRHEDALARALLTEAVAREPSDAVAWSYLAELDALTRRLPDAVQAEWHAREADPEKLAYRQAYAAARNAETLAATPPSASATAVGTPAAP